MTALAISFTLFALSVATLLFGSKKWRETGNEWYVILIFLDLFYMLAMGYFLRVAVFDFWNI